MIEVRISIFIQRSPGEVFDYISDFENNPHWQSGALEALKTSNGELSVGSTYTQVAKFLGRQVQSNFIVTEYEPGRMVKMESDSGSFPIAVTRMVHPEGEGSRVRSLVEGEPKGYFKITEPILGRMVRRSVEADYDRLKQILESSLE